MNWQLKSFTFNPFSENTYVIWKSNGHGWIIDPGCSDEQEYLMLHDFLIKHDIRPAGVLLTHAHIDHILGCHYFTRKHELAIYVHPQDRYNLEMAGQVSRMYAIPYTPFGEALNYDSEKNGLPDSDESIKLLYCPGHSKGSVCLYAEREKFLVAGDVLFRESIGRTDLPGGNMNELERSIKEQVYVLPDDVVVYPGHGPSTTIGHEKKNNPFVSG